MNHQQTHNETSNYDLIVIGGGAAGFFTAIQTAEALKKINPSTHKNHRILLLEKSAQLLGKVKISGGGRCNVTHACFDAKSLSKHYPRGEKSLIGPFNHFQSQEMIDWLKGAGVELKTESDGRMFPTSDSSQTIIDTFLQAAKNNNIEIRIKSEVKFIQPIYGEKTETSRASTSYNLQLKTGESLHARQLMIATGGTRLKSSSSLAEQLGHELKTPVPSLFTFNIEDPCLTELAGLSVANAEVRVPSCKLQTQGAVLITHWGLSGPAILKMSAWGARKLHDLNYNFNLEINWLPKLDTLSILQQQRQQHGKRLISKRSPIKEIPRRLWEKLTKSANITPETTWSQLNKKQLQALQQQIHQNKFQAKGQSIHKEEFVTCGGVPLKEITTKSFESKKQENLYFAGEILDIDGITGGFNFQNAWTNGYLAAQEIAKRLTQI